MLSAKVSLDDKLGEFEYDPSMSAPDLIVEFINKIGNKFTASLQHQPSTIRNDPNGSGGSTCHIRIVGMTCQSCVKTITNKMSEFLGVKSIVVSLQVILSSPKDFFKCFSCQRQGKSRVGFPFRCSQKFIMSSFHCERFIF